MADENRKPKPDGRPSYTRRGFEEAGSGFLRALGDGLGEIFDRGLVEVEEIARTSKAHYDRHQAERERDALYRRLGQQVVQEIAAGRLDLPCFEELLRQIAEAEERVASFAVEEGKDGDPGKGA
jgi:hypothetical protein